MSERANYISRLHRRRKRNVVAYGPRVRPHLTTRRVLRERTEPIDADPQAEAWQRLIEDAPDNFQPKRREKPKITLPRLKFLEKPFDEEKDLT